MIKGSLIAFFGTDGTGKSTVANLIEEHCKAHGLKTQRYHWRPRLLPSLSSNRSGLDISHPDEHSTKSWIASLITYLYVFCDFLLANIFKFQPYIRKGGIIIYERYYYDILFHPRRYRSKEIKIMAAMLAKLTIPPNLIVYLFGEPHVIQARKPELSVSEISRQQILMKQTLPNYSRVLEIDVTEQKPLDVAYQILDEIAYDS